MSTTRRWPTLVAATDHLCALAAIVWWLGFARDWLLSPVDPYPYVRSLLLCTVASAPLVCMGLKGCMPAPGALSRQRVDRRWLIAAGAASAGAMALLLAELPGRGRPTGADRYLVALGSGIGAARVHEAPLRGFELQFGALGSWSAAALLACSAFAATLVVGRNGPNRRLAALGLVTWAVCLALAPSTEWAVVTGGSLCAALCLAAFRREFGPMAGRPTAALPSRLGKAARAGALVLVTATALSAAIHVALHGRVTRRLADALRGTVPWNQVSPAMLEVTVATEDRNFYRHAGFDASAIHSALRQDLREGRIVRGGSTITQQLAKALFLSPERTLARKLAELAFALEIERVAPKQRILALYLSQVDYGLGRRGISQAARGYFHTTPDRLTLGEAALLAAYAQRPPVNEAEAIALLPRREVALARLRTMGSARFSPSAIDAAGAVPLDHLIYPYRAAYDRGATAYLPAVASGIALCSWLSPEHPEAVPWAAPRLRWAYLAVLPALYRLGVRGIEHVGLFADRATRSNAAMPSAHAYGLALDLRAFRLSGGRVIAVADHRRAATARLLAPIVGELRRGFDVVVDWRDDPRRHDTHIHVEMRKEARP